MSQLIKIDKEYAAWIQQVSERFRQSQLKAAVSVNSEMLKFYWMLGEEIVDRKVESKWGAGIVKTISQDLQTQLSGVKGLSETNVDYMKRFYVLYSGLFSISPQPVGKLYKQDSPQVVEDLFKIPWGTIAIL
jgi:hypothetical protein